MTKKRLKLREIFLGLQDQMRVKLSLNKEILSHPVAKGSASELEWIDMLSTYLPTRYRVEQAFVIDYTGALSDQIDIVIIDRHYTPFLFRQNGQTFVPVESVYAVIEVKQELNIASIEYAAKKANSVRSLKRTNAEIVDRGVLHKPRRLSHIYSGILTLRGKITQPKANKIKYLRKNRTLDLGCSLLHGSFYFDKNNKVISIGKAENSLIFFFLKLFECLQVEGTVAPMQISKYIDVID